jgi:hypothetical protein
VLASGGVDDETPDERLNRNLEQLLEELRVVITGVQVLFGFLLAVPFASRFRTTDRFEHLVYFAALLCAGVAAVCLLAPSLQHRLLFRREQKAWLVVWGSRLMVAGMSALAVSMTCSLVLVSHFLYGAWAGWIAAVASVVVFGSIWYALPLDRRRRSPPPDRVR